MVGRIKKKNRNQTSAAKTAVRSGHGFRYGFCVIVSVCIIAAVSGWVGRPAASAVPRAGQIQPFWPQMLEQARPQVILLGDSMLGYGVDEKLFSELAGLRTVKMWGGGWSSAVWYLAMKNVIVQSSAKPQAVVLFFRDHYLTEPAFRVSGPSQVNVDQFAGLDEPVLDRLAYLDNMHPAAYWLSRQWSVYQQRRPLKKGFETAVKEAVGDACGIDGAEAMNRTIEATFGRDALEMDLLGKAQDAYEGESMSGQYEFAARVEKSFLPHIAQLARSHQVQLILVRVKRRREAEGQPAPAGLANYVSQLQNWCGQEGVAWVDFSDEPQLKPEHYADGDHLNRPAGIELMTRLTAQKVLGLLNEKDKTP